MRKKYKYCSSIIKVIITGGLIISSGCKKDLFTPAGTVTDIDGNTYIIVKIGTQTWFGENLKTTTFNNGISIPNFTNTYQWPSLTTSAYCCYENSPDNQSIYGNLYNWYAVNTSNLCPTGWHVPSATEWQTLENFLGGSYNAGGRLKEMGLTHWDEPNFGAINSSGFTALPAGSVSIWNFTGTCEFLGINNFAGFWSSTEVDWQTAVERDLNSDDHALGSWNDPKYCGLSIRCIKDN
jgi:uncharacterized protein (TIGR02145 family)